MGKKANKKSFIQYFWPKDFCKGFENQVGVEFLTDADRFHCDQGCRILNADHLDLTNLHVTSICYQDKCIFFDERSLLILENMFDLLFRSMVEYLIFSC